MRLSGCVRQKEQTIPVTSWSAGREVLVTGPIVVPHEVIATQHGIAADSSGVGCSSFCAGSS